ncbi:MAG: aquaporin [Pirellulales bacterium]
MLRLDENDRPKLFAEAIGTFALVFAGTGAIVIDHTSHGAISHAGIALTFGLIVLAMIYAIGDVSGCHLNPAVTLGFLAAGRFEKKLVIPYLFSQFLGAFLASVTLKSLFPFHSTLGTTLPSGPIYQSFVLEGILTAILMFVILRVSSGAKEKGIMAGVAIGSVIALEAMFAGPICGSFHESSPLVCTSSGFRNDRTSLDLFDCPMHWSLHRHSALSIDSRQRIPFKKRPKRKRL